MTAFVEIRNALESAEKLVSSLRRLLDLSSPTTPQNVSASANQQIVNLNWDAAIGARSIAGYRIYRGGVQIASVSASPYDDPDLSNGSYVYAVAAVDAQGTEGTKATASTVVVSVSPAAPGTPRNFVAPSANATQLNLSWGPDTDLPLPDDYELDFSTNGSGGPWTSITVGNQVSLNHSGLTTNQLYTYRLRASLAGVAGPYAFTTGRPVSVVTTSAATFHFGLDLTSKATWRTSDDVLTGWDWSWHPSQTPPDLSGEFQFASGTGIFNSNWPANFPGKKIYKINADWRQLEPVRTLSRDQPGTYQLGIFDQLETLNDEWDGVQIDVRGAVYALIVSASTEVYQGTNVTAPDWLRTGSSAMAYTGTLNTGDGGAAGGRFRYYNIGDSDWYTPFRHLIRAIADYTIPGSGGTKLPAHPRLVTQIVHGQSNSHGEEDGFGTPSSNHVATLEVWASAYGANAHKLGWCGEGRDQVDNDAAITAGLGSRGGIIENFLRAEYTPHLSDSTSDTGVTKMGQSFVQYLNASSSATPDNYYLSVDESFPIIAGNRHFADQLEFPKQSSFTNPDPWEIGSTPNKVHQGITFGMLRVLQMRRNVLAIENPGSYKNQTGATAINGSEGFFNPEVLKWGSLILGTRVDGVGGSSHVAREAWIALMQTWTRSLGFSGTANNLIHNFEFFLKQRETWGGTILTQNAEWGWNPQGGSFELDDPNFPADPYWHINRARRMANATTGFGLQLDDRFITGSAPVAVKVVYLDNNTQTWCVEYTNTASGTSRVFNTNANTGLVKTRTFFISDFKMNTTASNPDLRIKGLNSSGAVSGTTTPFMFVRVIKT